MQLRCILLTLCVVLYRFATAESLYDAQDPILELETDTFNAAVYNSEKAHFVEFYSSWCGACIAYAPTFKEFAKHLAPWRPLVQVTVVNCADDKNMPLCREHSVNSFPTIKFFKQGATSKDDGQQYTGNKYEINQMELDVAAYLHASYEKDKHRLAGIFDPVDNTKTLEEMWASAGSANLLGIASQEDPALMPWALIINFHADRNVKVVLARPQHPVVVRALESDSNGRFLLYKRGDITPIWTSPAGAKWIDIQEKVNEYIAIYGVDAKASLVEPQAPAPVANVDMTQFQVQLVDLKSTIFYMLFKEIPRRQFVEGDDLVALKQWMRTMSKYAPGTTPIRRLLYRMNEWIWSLGDKMDTNDWTNKLQEVQVSLGNPLPDKVEWIACIGSKPNLRGYTCGLWTTAHAISVAAYKAEKNNAQFNPVNEVMEPFHQFIFRFLSCGECAKNFNKEAEKHKLLQVKTAHEMVMWFWRVHNFVNARLSGSRTDDPRFPKRQFPPSASAVLHLLVLAVVCPQCYDSNGGFDEEQIFNFLLTYYSDIKQDSLKAVASRHLNPKFAVHADQVDKLEQAEDRLRKEVDASPHRAWKDIEGYDNVVSTGRSQFYFIWLTVIGLVIVLAYCKYRRNRSKFWKTFYYHSDFKLFPWSAESTEKKYAA
ncbi:hypothetical protein Q1695_011803 [Nippostrongylus brasiliensis]|nr:hypothetical protein Q1695_011803 [Nippostrongylus brasiliensis]